MKTKLFTLLFAVAASVGTMFAEPVQIGDLYYNLDATSQTAEVTYKSYTNYEYNKGWGITTANIPASVTYNSVTYSVTSIREWAFANCTGLTSIEIPNSVTSIGQSAFRGCTGLTSVTIPNSVTRIGDYAFHECTGLTSVTIPNSVTSIGEYAFSRCSSLTSVTIPNSVTSIGDQAFHGCSGLTSINVASDNSNYCSVDGVLLNKDKTTLIQYPGGKQGAYTIPNSVTSIGYSAFVECTGLTSVTIPNSVTSIGYWAFNGCTGLTSVTIPNSVTSIGPWAFDGCSGLTSVTIPNSVTSIGYQAFYGCSSLTSVTIPNSVTSIGGWAFYNCTGLTGELVIPNSVTSIGENAFFNCGGLTSVTIPNSVTSIGNSAFAGCSGLTSIEIPNSVTSIDGAFSGCSGLTSVTIPNSVTSIGNYAFSGCTGLTSVTIPNSVTRIGSGAFWGCSRLTSVTCLATTPPMMGPNVFYDVNRQIPVYVPAESLSAYKTADVWKEFTNILPIEETSATPSVTDVTNAGYNPDNNIVFCVHFTEEATVCNDIVWAGTYNGWNTNIDQMLTFSHLVGFDNWYAVEFSYAEETAGVPVSLKLDGSFSWDYICGPGNAWMYKGGKEAFITNILDDKIDAIRFYDGAGVYMYEMTYWNQHRDPCVQLPVHTYTVNLYAPNACSDMKPAVIGDFNNWDIYSVSAMSELTDTNGKKYYSYSFNDEELHSFKIVAAAEYEVDWNTEMKHFDATKGGWVTVENYILSADSIITLDWSDNRHYRYGTCETGLPDPTTYTINFVNDDGSIIDSRAWDEGTMPSCVEPTKEDDDYIYCFAGWQPQIKAVTETATYQATYEVCGGWISASVYWKLQGDTLMVDGSGVIPDYAQGTAPWGSYAGRINVVYIADGISRIGEWAFADMSMSVVRIPEDVTVIGANAFKGCTSIKNVYFGGNASQWATINFVNEYSNPLYYGATLYDAKLEIPVTHTISTNAFIGMSTVVYHGTLEQWCTMTFTSDYIPSYDLIIDGEIVSNPCFGEGLTAISAYAFRGCRSIRSVCIPASMQQIGTDAFSHTPNLAKVLYAGTLAQWCDITFANAEANPACHADLYFDDEKLGTRIDIPASLTSIRAFAFPNKETLNVYFHGTNPNGYMLNSFGEPQEVGNKHFYVPCGTIEDYQTQLNYNESLFTENYPFSYQVLSGQEAMGKVQVVHAPDCEDQQLQIKAIPNAEYRFVQWSDGSTEAERALTLHSDTILKATFAIDSVTIRFFMDDGTLYVEKNIKYGEMPIVADPYKEPTAQYTYSFARWTPELKPATYDTSYRAVFDRTVNTYMVYFINWDGVLLGEQEVAYGSAAMPPAVPEREHYHFAGWNTNIYMITGRTFAVAQFKKNGGYTIHYRNGVDDSEIDGEEIDLNFPEPPVIEGFVFVGWEIVCGSVITEGIEIQAVYEPSTVDAIDNEVVNPANPVQKLIRNGNVYILTDDNTYTIQGQKVK